MGCSIQRTRTGKGVEANIKRFGIHIQGCETTRQKKESSVSSTLTQRQPYLLAYSSVDYLSSIYVSTYLSTYPSIYLSSTHLSSVCLCPLTFFLFVWLSLVTHLNQDFRSSSITECYGFRVGSVSLRDVFLFVLHVFTILPSHALPPPISTLTMPLFPCPLAFENLVFTFNIMIKQTSRSMYLLTGEPARR